MSKAAPAGVIPPNATPETVLAMVANEGLATDVASRWFAENSRVSRIDNSKPLFRRTSKNRVWFQLGRGKGKQTSGTVEFESLRMFARAVLEDDPSVAPFRNGGSIKDIPLSKAAAE